jgi:hypothetical protein
VTAWEDDQTKLNLFKEIKNSAYIPYLVRLRFYIGLPVMSAQVHKQLVEEEIVAARLSKITVHDVFPSTFIHTGLELEKYQYVSDSFHQHFFDIYPR